MTRRGWCFQNLGSPRSGYDQSVASRVAQAFEPACTIHSDLSGLPLIFLECALWSLNYSWEKPALGFCLSLAYKRRVQKHQLKPPHILSSIFSKHLPPALQPSTGLQSSPDRAGGLQEVNEAAVAPGSVRPCPLE